MDVWRRVALPVLVAVLVVVAGFLALTRGADLLAAAEDRPMRGEPRLPASVRVAPETLPTTADHGPLGPVSLVFAAVSVESGLTGHLTNPWVAVSSLDGTYRAISRTDLPSAARGTAVSVAPDGRRLAWADGDSVVLYDPVRDRARRQQLDGLVTVGAFSPDGRRLLLHDGVLRSLDVRSGETTRLVRDASASVAPRAAFSPEGDAVTWVEGGRLRTARLDGSTVREQRFALPQTTTLAWSPSGRELASLGSAGGRLQVWRSAGGRVRTQGRVSQPRGVYVERLVGFTGEHELMLVGLTTATGTLPQLFSLDLRSGATSAVTALPSQGENWVDAGTVSFAGDALANGSEEFPPPPDPWSDRGKLSMLVIVTVFLLGLWLTRKRARRRR